MNMLSNYFQSLSPAETASQASFFVPGIREGSETNILIEFQGATGYLYVHSSSNSTYMDVLSNIDGVSPDLKITINKTIDEFKVHGLNKDDIEIEGLTNRKSTNSKIVNAIDFALYHLNGNSRISNGLHALQRR